MAQEDPQQSQPTGPAVLEAALLQAIAEKRLKESTAELVRLERKQTELARLTRLFELRRDYKGHWKPVEGLFLELIGAFGLKSNEDALLGLFRARKRGAPRKDAERARVLQLRAGGKSWARIQQIMNNETGQSRTANAYRNLVQRKP